MSILSRVESPGKPVLFDQFRTTVIQPKHNNYSDTKTNANQKKDTSCSLPPKYDPSFVESEWYDWWVESGYFTPEYYDAENKESFKKKFVICLPPPNVTGTLHLGHALTNAIQDAIVRWHRMHGEHVLWNPGTDHAGIATQVVVEKKLWRDQQKTRHDLGRSKFRDEVWKWREQKGNAIYAQMKRMGSSIDWSRDCFTMDQKFSHAVEEAFIRLYNEGLITRKNRLVNWSCHLKSTISDIEVDEVPINGKTLLPVPGYNDMVEFGTLMSFAYPILGTGKEIVVSTTRVETMLGDTAIAVHPDDDRYRHLLGQVAVHPFTDQRIPIIPDGFVDRHFGTGAVKITPAHDFKDYEVGQRHHLPLVTVIDENGCINEQGRQFKGMKRFDARMAVIEALKHLGLFRGEVEHSMNLPLCSRSKDIVEPLLKEQWFLDCTEMAQKAIEAVKNKELELIPSYYDKTWYHWLENTDAWCISRQLWWGHQIPAYQVKRKSEDNTRSFWIIGRNMEEVEKKASDQLQCSLSDIQIVQDDDVLDTWFSSALFPFAIFGWPEQTNDLNSLYPTDLLETGRDILFFWVARMVMLGERLTGQLPFNQVLLHGILRDAQGRKMSKSLGNVIDPLHVISGISLENLLQQHQDSNLDESEIKQAISCQKREYPAGIPACGADALRFTLCSYDYKDAQINMNIQHVKSNYHFLNKIWQAFRFVMNNLGADFKPVETLQGCVFDARLDEWILSRLSHMVSVADKSFLSYDLQEATKAMQEFWLLDFCDVYLECSKPIFQGDDYVAKETCKQVLYTCLETTLRALSPFMPFLTEELFQRLPSRPGCWPESICIASYPLTEHYPWKYLDVENDMQLILEICKGARSIRSDYNLASAKAHVFLYLKENSTAESIVNYASCLKLLSRSQSVTLVSSHDVIPEGCSLTVINPTCELHMQLKGLLDPVKEIARLQRVVKKLEGKRQKMEKVKSGHKYSRMSEVEQITFLEKLQGLGEEIAGKKGRICMFEAWSELEELKE